MVQSIDDARRRQQVPPGRVPPHNLRAEESLLGAMLLSRDAIAEALEVGLNAGDFYKPAHGHIYDAVHALYGAGEPADPVTVADELARAGLLEAIGGQAVLISLQASTPATSNAAHYARIVEEHALLRRLIRVGGEIAEIGYALPDDVLGAVDSAESMVFEVAQRRVTDSMVALRDLVDRGMNRLEELFANKHAVTGLATGFADLDDLLSGLQPSAFIVIGARPAMGKSAFALDLASHAAIAENRPVLFFSLEMGADELTQRLLSSQSRVDSKRVRTGNLLETDWSKIHQALGKLTEAPLYIDDNPNLTVMEIRAKARRLKSRLGDLGLIVIDYLQLMTGRSAAENRQVEVAEISRGLKILARELEVPVVALSQLSRALEQRTDKKPVLADLRESGCLTASTRVMRADTGASVSLGELLEAGARDIPVWTLDERYRLVRGRMSHVFASGEKPVFRLELASGRWVEASGNHPFLTLDGWRPLEELNPGDAVAVPRRLARPTQRTAWPDDEVTLAAHLLRGARHDDDREIRFRPTDTGELVLVEKAAVHFGGPMRLEGRELVFPPGSPVAAWVESLGLCLPPRGTRYVPAPVFGLDDRQVRLFLRHLGDARVHSDDVRALELRLGLLDDDRVPGSEWERLRGRLDEQGISERSLPRALGSDVAIGDDLERDVASGLARLLDDERLLALATGDVCWDPVIAVEPLGVQPVFDAEVAGTHCFLADGIVVHNSIEQDADVVMFLYRDEQYNPETENIGVADVIVAKHRNGPTGRVSLTFLSRFTKFADLAKV